MIGKRTRGIREIILDRLIVSDENGKLAFDLGGKEYGGTELDARFGGLKGRPFLLKPGLRNEGDWSFSVSNEGERKSVNIRSNYPVQPGLQWDVSNAVSGCLLTGISAVPGRYLYLALQSPTPFLLNDFASNTQHETVLVDSDTMLYSKLSPEVGTLVTVFDRWPGSTILLLFMKPLRPEFLQGCSKTNYFDGEEARSPFFDKHTVRSFILDRIHLSTESGELLCELGGRELSVTELHVTGEKPKDRLQIQPGLQSVGDWSIDVMQVAERMLIRIRSTRLVQPGGVWDASQALSGCLLERISFQRDYLDLSLQSPAPLRLAALAADAPGEVRITEKHGLLEAKLGPDVECHTSQFDVWPGTSVDFTCNLPPTPWPANLFARGSARR